MADGKGRILTIASGKGGTGKTIVAANLGTGFTLLGRKVVIVDADLAMADLGLYLGLEKSPITLHEVLAGEAGINQALYDGPGGCKVVPSGLSLSGFSRANPQRLKEVIDKLSREFDYVILDTSSGLSKESTMPLAVGDEVILVVNPDMVCLADALRVKMMCDAVDTKVAGVVINRTGMSKTELVPKEVGSMLGIPILAVIPEDDEVKKTASLKVPVVMRKDGPAKTAFMKLAKQVDGSTVIKSVPREPKNSRIRSIFGK